MQKKIIPSILIASMTFIILLQSSGAIAAVSIGLSGSWAKNHLGLQSQTTQSGKASVTADLGPYFRLGYSFRQTFQNRKGYIDKASDGEDEDLVYFEQSVNMMTHSMDIFAVLYAGRIFTPFIFVGAAVKYYKITIEEEDTDEKHSEYGPLPVPNYGLGMAVAINRTFSAKITNTWSSGVSTDAEGKSRRVRDSQIDIGISYKIE